MTERDFQKERLVARLTELKQQYDNHELDRETFKIETTKVLVALEQDPWDRATAKGLLGALKALNKFS